MASKYTVRPGDHLARIAARFGYASWEPLWNHADNAELKGKRKSPHLLLEGDELAIPDASDEKKVKIATGKFHRFVLKTSKLKVRLKVLDLACKPRKSLSGVLTLDGRPADVATDGDGLCESDVHPATVSAKLAFGKDGADGTFALDLGALDPIEAPTGYLGRLLNLGYLFEQPGDVDEMTARSAVEEFQCDNGVKVTGDFDAATKKKLEEVHGS